MVTNDEAFTQSAHGDVLLQGSGAIPLLIQCVQAEFMRWFRSNFLTAVVEILHVVDVLFWVQLHEWYVILAHVGFLLIVKLVHLLAQLKAVHDGHADVSEDDAEVESFYLAVLRGAHYTLLDYLERLVTVLCFEVEQLGVLRQNLLNMLAHDKLKHAQSEWLVVDDQDWKHRLPLLCHLELLKDLVGLDWLILRHLPF